MAAPTFHFGIVDEEERLQKEEEEEKEKKKGEEEEEKEEIKQEEVEDSGVDIFTGSLNSSLSFSEQMSQYISSPKDQCWDDAVVEVDTTVFTSCIPSLLQIVQDKLLAITVEGHSVFHIAVHNNSVELLRTFLTVAWFMCHSLDIKLNLKVVFVLGDETPVAMAVKRKHSECLRLLLDFLRDVDLLKMVVADDRLLKMAVGTGNMETVKLLVRFGINKGLEEAISLAASNHFPEVLRLLMFHYTQITNMRDNRNLQGERKMVGELKWSHLLFLTEVRSEWIEDSTSAVESVHSAIHMGSVSTREPLNNHLFDLAARCLHYFDDTTLQSRRSSCSLKIGLVAITTVEICESGLKSVPPELFQMPHLSSLTLAHNFISGLPSALSSPQESVYTCRSLKKLVLDDNQLSVLPEDLFLGLVCTLEELSVQRNRLTDLPPGLWVMPHLKTLRLSGNMLCRLHYLSGMSKKYFEELERDPVPSSQCVTQLKLFYQTLCRALKITDNFEELVAQIRLQRRCLVSQLAQETTTQYAHVLVTPPTYTDVGGDEDADRRDISHLQFLDLSNNMFSEVPLELVCLAPRLNRLDMKHNVVTKVDLVRSLPRSVSTVYLDHNIIVNTVSTRPAYIQCSSPQMMLLPQPQEGCLFCSHASHTILGRLTTLGLSYNKIQDFSVCEEVEYCLSSAQSTSLPSVPTFPALSILALNNNALRSIPKSIHQLTSLGSLDFSYNVAIQELPLEMGLLDPQTLCVLRLQGLNINTVPVSLLEKSSPRPLLTYLKSKLQRFGLCFLGLPLDGAFPSWIRLWGFCN